MATTQRTNDSKQTKRRSTRKTQTTTDPAQATSTITSAESPAMLEAANNDPRSASPASILMLHRKFGNRAVSRLMQTKLTVGAANDKYEQEADHVAQQVMSDSTTASVQRHHLEGEEDVQRKPLAATVTPIIQRHQLPLKKGGDEEEKLEEEEEGSVQRRAATPTAGGFEAGPDIEQKLAAGAGRGQSLPDTVRGDMEQRIGSDFSGVKVHTGSDAVQLNRDLSAQAFTHGKDIYFGAGKYNPAASEGKHLLAHELTHVVQQSGYIAPKRIQRKIRSPRQWWRDREKKKQESSYNIRWGQELPDTNDMAGSLIKERIEEERSHVMDVRAQKAFSQTQALEVPALVEKIDDDTFWNGLLTQYNSANKTTVNATDVIPDIKGAVRAHSDKADLDTLIYQVKVDLKKKKDAFTIHRDRIVSALKSQVSDLARSKAEELSQTDTTPVQSVYHSSDAPYLQGDSTQATKQFLAMRGTYEMGPAYLDKTQRKAFSTALKEVPTVKVLLNPKSVAKDFRQTTGWKDGGTLVEKLQIVEDLDKPKGALMPSPHRLLSAKQREKINKKRAASKSFREKVNTVDRLTRIMVEPELLSLVVRPTLYLHTAAAAGFSAPWGYRANANKGFVNISYNEDMEVIAHEVGHAIEGYLPLERWHDIHMLMGARHQAEGGGKARAGATPLITSLSEGRYAGKYTTGKYTTTAYKDGNAEVVSMAMQYFVEPAKALELIEGDPQHAAIVLRGFRPNEYAATDALRPFDKYIPHKKAKPKLPPRPSPEKLKMIKARATHKNKPLPPLPVKDKDTV
jgi:hypothetical protein